MRHLLVMALLLLAAVPVQGGAELLSTMERVYETGSTFEHDGDLYQFWAQNHRLFLIRFTFNGTILQNTSFPLDFEFNTYSGDKLDNDTFVIARDSKMLWMVNGTIVDQLDLVVRYAIIGVVAVDGLIYSFNEYWKVNVINATSKEQWSIELDNSDLPSGFKDAATTNGTHFFVFHVPSAASRGRTLAPRIALMDMSGRLVAEYDSPSQLGEVVTTFIYEGDLYAYCTNGLFRITLEPMTRIFKLLVPALPLMLAVGVRTVRRRNQR